MGSFAKYTQAERDIVKYYDRKLRRMQRRLWIMNIIKWFKKHSDNFTAIAMFIGIMIFHAVALQLCYGGEAKIPPLNPVEQAVEHWTYPNYLYSLPIVIPCDTDIECEELNPYVYDWDEVVSE